MTENQLASIVFRLGMKVHRELGPGLLESVYEECLCYELKREGVQFERQKSLSLLYSGVEIESKLKLDLVLEDKLIVELKSVNKFEPIHMAQILTYLKLSQCKLGLLINFNTSLFKSGVRRVINGTL
ncbi:MAG: GxxExxY protein [Flavobacteriales bacterium]|nr:GxxExxY protein [Flavobacteriales bacterium]